MVTVFNNQDPMDKGHKLLLHRRNLVSMETIVTEIASTISLIGGIRRLHSLRSGQPLRSVEELLAHDEAILAYRCFGVAMQF